MPTVTVGDADLFYELDDFTDPWNRAETVLIQHGTGRNGRFWGHWVPRLAAQYRVIRRDQLGHGRSSQVTTGHPWLLRNLADEMARFLDAFCLDAVHYLGESNGGLVGLEFAVRHPDRVRSLTLCAVPLDTAPPKNDIFKAGFLDSETAKRTLGADGWTRAMIDRRVISGGSPERTEWVIREMRSTNPETLVGIGSTHYAPNEQPAELAPRVQAPTLILAPARSPVTSLEDQLVLASLLCDVSIAVVDGASHEIYVDRADECITAVLRFLGGTRARGLLGRS